MKVYIKNKLISLGGSSQVLNENQEPIFVVKGKVFSFTKKKKIYDTNENLLYTIRNRFWNWLATKVYIYDNEKNRIATIKKGKYSFNANFEIEDCVDDMRIDGKVFSLTSTIIKNEQPVGVIVRNFTIIKDAFTLEAEEQEIPFLTALVIAFDNIKDKLQND